MSAVTGINKYGSTPSADEIRKQANDAAQKLTGGKDLSMQNFLELLTKQMTNQDMMNPQSDTEFIAQMAQFSALQAAQVTNEITYAQYGASMAGKVVGLATISKKGDLVQKYGVVSSVNLVGGKVTIVVDGEEYDISAVMSVHDKMPEEKPGTDPVIDPAKPETEPDVTPELDSDPTPGVDPDPTPEPETTP